jgi:transposase
MCGGFCQDNASIHTANETLEWLEEDGVSWIGDWPANSPDLNLIENVWGIMVRRMGGRNFDTEAQLWAAVVEEWDNISYDTIRKLYKSVRMRYQAVLGANGKHTKY